jgi:glycosyltransferase involved in cell wall biosynthesis
MTIYAFTSVAVNYIPKARVLARSLKRLHPEIKFCLLLAEPIPAGMTIDCGDFDSVETLEQLGIENLKIWLFQHSLVEVCTAIKGFYLCQLLERNDCESVLYFDPDMVIVSALTPILSQLPESSVLLTPHLLSPEQDQNAIRDNELSALKHGLYNLGFLGVNNTQEGRKFAHWWRDRLEDFCFDDIPSGIFTDQRWVDLAPIFFKGVRVIDHPGCNVATWNLSHRLVHGNFETGFFANEHPLVFYHFSGFDSGNQLSMLQRYGKQMPALYALRDWYIGECDRFDQPIFAKNKWSYDHYDNGESITKDHRQVYRTRNDLQKRFTDPFCASEEQFSYLQWYEQNVGRKRVAGITGGKENRPLIGDIFGGVECILDSDATDLQPLVQGAPVLSRRNLVTATDKALPFDKVGFFPYFDPEFYLAQYPAVADTAIDPLVHYLTMGAWELKNPSLLFDTCFYFENHRDVIEAGINPLKHFIQVGWRLGYNPHPLFDVSFYLDKNADVREAGVNPLKHYILFGWREGRDPHPLFDTSFYVEQHASLIEPDSNPLAHYVMSGFSGDFDPHPMFDSQLYLLRNPDVSQSQTNPLIHFCTFGWLEHRDPNAWFSISNYLNSNPELVERGSNPFIHFINKLLLTDSFNQSASDYSRSWAQRFYPSCVLFEQPERLKSLAQHCVGDKPVILMVGLPGGGVGKHVSDLCEFVQRQAVVLTLTPLDDAAGRGWVQLKCPHLGHNFVLTFDPMTQFETLVDVLRGLNVDRVHIHHIMNSQRFIKELISELAVPFDFTAHDYYVLSPALNLFEGLEKAATGPSLSHSGAIAWQRENAWLIDLAERVVVPSRDVETRIARFFPNRELIVAPHVERSRIDMPVLAKNLRDKEPLRILLLGEMRSEKGAEILHQCAGLVTLNNYPIVFELLGHLPNSFDKVSDKALNIRGQYHRDELQKLIFDVDAHLCWFPSQCPETYSYTLSSAFEAGLPVVVPDIGAFPERVSGRQWSFVFNWNSTAQQWIDLFILIRNENFAPRLAPAPFQAAVQNGDAKFYERDYLNWVKLPRTLRQPAHLNAPAVFESVLLEESAGDSARAGAENSASFVTNHATNDALESQSVQADGKLHGAYNAQPSNEQALLFELQATQCDLGETLFELQTLKTEIAQLRGRIDAIEGTATWKARNKLLGLLPK